MIVGCTVLGCVESIEGFEAHLQALRFCKGHLETSSHCQVQDLVPAWFNGLRGALPKTKLLGAKRMVLNHSFFERLGTVNFCPGTSNGRSQMLSVFWLSMLSSTSKGIPLAKSIRPENPQPPVTDLTNDLSLRRADVPYVADGQVLPLVGDTVGPFVRVSWILAAAAAVVGVVGLVIQFVANRCRRR